LRCFKRIKEVENRSGFSQSGWRMRALRKKTIDRDRSSCHIPK